jgi:hypothetical protein
MKKLALVVTVLAVVGVLDVPIAFSEDIYVNLTFSSFNCSPTSCQVLTPPGYVNSGVLQFAATCNGGATGGFTGGIAGYAGTPSAPCKALYVVSLSVPLTSQVYSNDDGCYTIIETVNYATPLFFVLASGGTPVYELDGGTLGCDGSEEPQTVTGTRPC